MSEPDLIEARPPPKGFDVWKRYLFFGVAIVAFAWIALWSMSAVQRHVTLNADNTFRADGVVMALHDLELRPLDDSYAIRATVKVLDVSLRRSRSELSIMNDVCQSLIASPLTQVPQDSVFRVTLQIESLDSSQTSRAIFGVSDGNCAAHVQNNAYQYTMPGGLQGWILSEWSGKRQLFGGDDVTITITFLPRVDADPDPAEFDFVYACRVIFADWPMDVPMEVHGRAVTHLEVSAQQRIGNRLLHIGSGQKRTFEFDDPMCRGEAA